MSNKRTRKDPVVEVRKATETVARWKSFLSQPQQHSMATRVQQNQSQATTNATASSFTKEFAQHEVMPRLDPRNWFYYDLSHLREKSMKTLGSFGAILFNKEQNSHSRSDLVSSGYGLLCAVSNLIKGIYHTTGLMYALAPIPTVPIIPNQKFRKNVMKPLTAAFMLAAAPFFANPMDMSPREGIQKTFDTIGDAYMFAARFTENKTAQNQQDYFERHNLMVDAYDYFDPATYEYGDDPNADALRSFGLGNYVSRVQDVDAWSRTQIALIAYHASGVDPRAMAVLSYKETGAHDVISDNSSALGFAQYLEESWLRSLYQNKGEIIEFLNESGLSQESFYGSVVDTLLDFDRPVQDVLNVSSDPVYSRLRRSMSSSALQDMTLYDFYLKKISMINSRRIGNHKGIQLVNLLSWRTDNVMVGVVTGFDRMSESRGALAFDKTKELSFEAFLRVTAREYSKHHLGLTRWTQYNAQLRSSSGRNAYVAQHPSFSDAARSNRSVFYHGGDRSRPRTFAELEQYYIASMRSIASDHYDRISTDYHHLPLDELIRVPEWVDPSHADEWKAHILDGQEVFRPNRRAAALAAISDRLPENLSEVPSWSVAPLETMERLISWVVGKDTSVDRAYADYNEQGVDAEGQTVDNRVRVVAQKPS